MPNSLTVHDERTKLDAINSIKNFSLLDYMESARVLLSERYDATVTCLSLEFHITRLPHIVYGVRSAKKCACRVRNTSKHRSPSRCNHFDCFFQSLSPFFKKKKDNSCQKATSTFCLERRKTPSRRTNRKISNELKNNFIKFLFKKNLKIEAAFHARGVTSRAIQLAEQMIKCGIAIWRKNTILAKKIHKQTNNLKSTGKNTSILSKTREPTKKYMSVINLHEELVTETVSFSYRHLHPITNITLFSKKYFCSTCNYKFSCPRNLNLHNCNKVQEKAISRACDAPLFFKTNPEMVINEFLKDKSRLIIDNNYVFITLQKIDSLFVCDISLIEKNMIITTTTRFSNQDLEKLAANVTIFVHKSALPWKLKRFISNISVLSCLTSDEKKSKQFDMLTRHIISYLSHTIVFVCTKITDQLYASKFLRSLMTYFLNCGNQPDKCQIKYRQGKMSHIQLTGASTGLYVMQTSNFFPTLGQLISSQQNCHPALCNAFMSLVRLIQQFFATNVLTGFFHSSTSISQIFFHEYLAKNLYSMRSPPVQLRNQLFNNECRYGFLQFQKSLSGPEKPYKSYISVDFSKYFRNIMKVLTPYCGSCIEFEKQGVTFLPIKKKLPFNTFANVLLHAISACIFGETTYKLTGREYFVDRKHGVDALITLPLPYVGSSLKYFRIILQIDG